MASCHTHATLSGGAAVPAAPTEQSCISSHRIRRTHRNDCRRIFSHRFHRYSQIFRLRFCLLICAHPCNLWEVLDWCSLRGCTCLRSALPPARARSAPSNHTYPPTDFTEFTDFSGGEYSPTDFTDIHRFLGCVFAS